MVKLNKECVEEALSALKNFNSDDLEQYASEVFAKAKEKTDLAEGAALQAALKEVNNENAKKYFSDCMTKARDIEKFNSQVKDFEANKANMREMLVTRHRYFNKNVESVQKSAATRLSNTFYHELTPEEIIWMNNPKNSMDIYRAIDGKSAPEIAKKIAEADRKYKEARNRDLVLSDSLPLDNINVDRQFKAIHNADKIRYANTSLIDMARQGGKRVSIQQAQALWKDSIKKFVDLEKTYSASKYQSLDGQLDIKLVDEHLDGLFHDIINGKSDVATKSEVVNDKESLKRKRRMFFVFKDAESFGNYSKEYGFGNYQAHLNQDIYSSSRQIGLAKVFGSNPLQSYLSLKLLMNKQNPKSVGWWAPTDWMYNTVAGGNQGAQTTLSRLVANINSLTSMAKLPLVALRSVSDIANGITYGKRFGMDYFKTYGDHLAGLFNLLPDEEKKYTAKIFKTMFNSHLGYMGRFADANSTGELLQKVSSGYFRGIGLEALDNGNKLSTIHAMAKHLNEMSSRGFEKLPEALKEQFKLYDISPKEWDILRTKNEQGLFTTNNIENLTTDEIKSLYTEENKHLSVHDMRQNLEDKVYSLFNIAAENSVLTPGAWAKAWCTLGTQQNSIAGVITKSLMQFKMYTLSYIDRVLVGGVKNAGSAQSRMNFAVQLIAATLPLTVGSMMLENVVKGISPIPDWDKLSIVDREKMALDVFLPGLGIFGKALNANNQNSKFITNIIGGPGLSFMSDLLSIPLEAATGNTSGLSRSAKNVAEDVIPYDQIPFISPKLNEILGTQGYKHPAYQQLYGA